MPCDAIGAAARSACAAAAAHRTAGERPPRRTRVPAPRVAGSAPAGRPGPSGSAQRGAATPCSTGVSKSRTPLLRICTPMQSSRKAAKRVTTRAPLVPIRAISRSAEL